MRKRATNSMRWLSPARFVGIAAWVLICLGFSARLMAANPDTSSNLPPLDLDAPLVTNAYVDGKSEALSRRVEINDVIVVKIEHLQHWYEAAKKDSYKREHLPKEKLDVSAMELSFDNLRLQGVSPFYTRVIPSGGELTFELKFKVERNQKNRGAWQELLNHPDFERPIAVSVGFPEGWILGTEIDPRGGSAPPFFLVVMPVGKICVGLGLILLALIVFLFLARKTAIIRDPYAPLRPDGEMPFSLARFQMAFWLFLVIGSFFFLWVITAGDTDTITKSVLALLGISSGTALGSALVDAGKSSSEDKLRDVAVVDVGKSEKEIREAQKQEIERWQQELSQVVAAGRSIPIQEKDQIKAHRAKVQYLRSELGNLNQHLRYLRLPPILRFLTDLLSEGNVIAIHRFQMLVWTLILGVIFLCDLYSNLAMPEFSNTLLGFLGISGGTYVGFKIPRAKPEE